MQQCIRLFFLDENLEQVSDEYKLIFPQMHVGRGDRPEKNGLGLIVPVHLARI